ncbi:MAG: DUF1489 domain-containing protein [Paracoccaceae bacterium]|nr:DUF1489 domain-containing protein [Paracoccaceae bacterium]
MAKSHVNLVKLCVGVDSIADLRDWHALNPPSRTDGCRFHTTRMWPKREAEILSGGSLYWVIKGQIQCRQKITGMEEAIGHDGVRRCRIVLDPELILTQTAPRRPFQGWRYLAVEDTPKDLPKSRAGDDDLPADLMAELAEIGIL